MAEPQVVQASLGVKKEAIDADESCEDAAGTGHEHAGYTHADIPLIKQEAFIDPPVDWAEGLPNALTMRRAC